MVENLPANAEDRGSIPGLGRVHVSQGNAVCEPQLLSPCSRAPELRVLKPVRQEPVLYTKRNHCNEKPAPHKEEQPPARRD